MTFTLMLSTGDFLGPEVEARMALHERCTERAFIYDANFYRALANDVDERFVLLYAQCALHEYDKETLQ